MIRRALAVALISVFVALVASPWFACGGWQGNADACCAMMGDASQPDGAAACCAMKEAAGVGDQAAAVHQDGAAALALLAVPGPVTIPVDCARVTGLSSLDSAADISPLTSLHVPLRI